MDPGLVGGLVCLRRTLATRPHRGWPLVVVDLRPVAATGGLPNLRDDGLTDPGPDAVGAGAVSP